MMQAAIDRVMHTYGMLVNLTLEQERIAREKVTAFLAQSKTQDENMLAVEGIKFLRGNKPYARRHGLPSMREGDPVELENSPSVSLLAQKLAKA